MLSVFERKLSCQPRFDSAHELHDPHREDHLADPKDKHPFDDFCLHFRSVMLRHQSTGRHRRQCLFHLRYAHKLKLTAASVPSTPPNCVGPQHRNYGRGSILLGFFSSDALKKAARSSL